MSPREEPKGGMGNEQIGPAETGFGGRGLGHELSM